MKKFNLYRNNQSGGFSEEGLTIRSIANGSIECVSNHLTSFAILVSTQAVSILSSTCYSYIYVTGFAKRGLPHTSDFRTSAIHNLTCVIAMDLQIVQFRAPT